MTLLVISPDYASHLLPLATLATEWQRRGEEVVVATGPATASIVSDFGFSRINLQLGRGSNPGVIRAEDQPMGEDDALRGFFDATRSGMVETLRFQAGARSSDLLYEPVEKAREVLDVVEKTRPQQILVDHLAFGARLGLDSAGISYGDVVLGHPSALPIGDEVYGHPPFWPAAFSPAATELAGLRALNEGVRDRFTAEWNAALAVLNPDAHPSADAFAEHGDLLMLNYPEALHPPARTGALPKHVFLGSAVRTEPNDPEVEAWLAASANASASTAAPASARPLVYVSFGSFLSVRTDVLLKVADALRQLDVRVALASGSSDPAAFGDVPADWLVRSFLPQVTLLQHASLIVTHGGNNSVTEAATAGVPQLVLPFSTDQFAGAAGVVDAGIGIALPPNTASVDELREASIHLLQGDRDDSASGRARALGELLRASPGPLRAYEFLAAHSRSATTPAQ